MRFLLLPFLLLTYAWAADDTSVGAFTRKVEEFSKLRDAAGAKVGSLPKAATPEQIQAQQAKLLVEIRAQRMNAKQGDIFTPDVQPLFRKILKDNFTGSDKKDSRDTARQGNPANDQEKGETAPTVAVNAAYPKSAPLSTVPPLLLLELPKLSKDIEYRFVGQTLILWDNVSNIILDYMKGAAPGV